LEVVEVGDAGAEEILVEGPLVAQLLSMLSSSEHSGIAPRVSGGASAACVAIEIGLFEADVLRYMSTAS
jgi:hypothetical protein